MLARVQIPPPAFTIYMKNKYQTPEIDKLFKEGYLESSKEINSLFKSPPEIKEKIIKFNGFNGKTGRKGFSVYDIFGKKMTYYFINDEKSRERFSNYLLKTFQNKNPEATPGKKSTFTRLLHSYRLHTKLCTHTSQDNNIDTTKYGISDLAIVDPVK